MNASVAIWDLPIRLFHGLLVLAVTGAVVTAQIGGNLMAWHGRLGSLVLGLIVFRLLWGVVGSRTARFTSFVRGPAAIRAYLAGQWQGIGHNPLGALSVLALLGAIGVQALSGHFSRDDITFSGPLAPLLDTAGQEAVTRWHHLSSKLLYGLVALHVGAIVYYTRVRRQTLLRPMWTGKGSAPAGVPANAGGHWIGLAAALVLAGLVTWAARGGWIDIPPPSPPVADYAW